MLAVCVARAVIQWLFLAGCVSVWQHVGITVGLALDSLASKAIRDLARNEEFSEIAVINIFLQF